MKYDKGHHQYDVNHYLFTLGFDSQTSSLVMTSSLTAQ